MNSTRTTPATSALLSLALLGACEQPSAVIEAFPQDGGSQAGADVVAVDVLRGDALRQDTASLDMTGTDTRLPDAAAHDQSSGGPDAGSGIVLDWVSAPAGSFYMGSPATEVGRSDDETRHAVALTRGFEILKTEVTQRVFSNLLGYNPATFGVCGSSCPVETVTWHQAAAFCNALSDHYARTRCYSCAGAGTSVTCALSTGFAKPYDCPGYRLPTEAEWEYAARATSTSATYGGNLDAAHLVCEHPNPSLDSIAWFCGNSGGELRVAGTRSANAWGLQDMLGSVWEWCDDTWDREDYPAGSNTDPWSNVGGGIHPVRGGAYSYDAQLARAAFRGWGEHDVADSALGFRPVRTLP